MIYTLLHSQTPPSINQVGVGAGGQRAHWKYTKAKREWEGILLACLVEARVPKNLTRVEATCVLTFPTRHRRDEGNYRALLEKCLGDILVVQKWLPDDTPEHYTFGGLEFSAKPGPHLTAITLMVPD